MANFLSDYNQPTINSVQARLVLSNEILLNLGQNIVENDGEGVTQRFAKDAKGGRINVVRLLPATQKARSLGADYNGGNFPSTYGQPQTVQYGLDVITVLDEPVWIRDATKDMIPVDLVAGTTKNLGLLYARNVNAMTLAGKVAKSLKTAQLVEVGSTSDAWRLAVITANSKLDEGDATNGVDMFPTEDRIFVVKPSVRPYLLSASGVLIGGSNYAQDILAKGTIDTGSTRDQRNGYIGVIDGLPTYMLANAVWSLAEEYLGVPSGELTDVYGYISSGMANARGIALEDKIKIVDATAAAGIILQPDCRIGFESFYEAGNVFLVKSGFTEPDVTLKNFAPASRSKPTVAIGTLTNGVAVTLTLTLATSRTLTEGKFFFATTEITQTAAGFAAGYEAATSANKGTFTGTGNTSAAIATGEYIYVRAVDDLGNVTVTRSTDVC